MLKHKSCQVHQYQSKMMNLTDLSKKRTILPPLPHRNHNPVWTTWATPTLIQILLMTCKLWSRKQVLGRDKVLVESGNGQKLIVVVSATPFFICSCLASHSRCSRSRSLRSASSRSLLGRKEVSMLGFFFSLFCLVGGSYLSS